MTTTVRSPHLRYGTPAGRWVLLATVLGSGMAMLDSTVVNIALPVIGKELDTGLSGLQWTVNAYTLVLASLILLGGSISDRFGRRRVFMVGVVVFALASALCGLAQDIEMLVVSRALQGLGGAMLTPGSLAILQSSFHAEDRARAIGAWSGLGGVAAAIGPFLGGWLVESVSWRWVFLINLPLAVVVLVASVRHVPESRDVEASPRLDGTGAVLCALGLGGLTYGLITWGELGASSPVVWVPLVVGAVALAAFVGVERASSHPMMPLGLFRSGTFSAANAVTFAVYAALAGVLFLLVLTLQVVAGYGPVAAGAAVLPITVLMLLLSARSGALASRIGPRLPMVVGPLVCGAGVLLMSRIGASPEYWRDVLPPVVVLGLGLSLLVAPLTSTVLGAAPGRYAGVASGINNAVARAAGLLCVAALPVLVGLSGEAYADPARLQPAFQDAMVLCAGLLVLGSGLAALGVASEVKASSDHAASRPPVPEPVRVPQRLHCAVAEPPLEPSRSDGPATGDAHPPPRAPSR